MANVTKKSNKQLTKIEQVKFDKIKVFFRRPILKNTLKILTMEHGGFRSFKSVKNINRLFTNIDLSAYKTTPELESYIWCINYFSKGWLDGYTSPEIVAELAKRSDEYDNIKDEIIRNSLDDENFITSPEAKAIFDLVSEALSYGYIASLKDEYIKLLDDIDLNEPGSFKETVNRLWMISKSLLDIKHNTNIITNKIEFSTANIDSVATAISETIQSLSSTSNMLKIGITRFNTLLSPAYMNGRLYVYASLPANGKSLMLLKSALDIRKYNPGFVSKTPGMKPCVLYISMENTFAETIERIWNMTFDEPITNFSEDEAVSKLCNELGVTKVIRDDIVVKDENGNKSLADLIEKKEDKRNIEMVIQYYPYRSITTDDLYTIIQDLYDEGLEVCALVFDYIKRISPAGIQSSDVKLELDRIMNELKALAVILNIPVITAHQLNRAAATTVDNALRQGKGDVTKLIGRDNIGSAVEVFETADWLCILNIEYKPGTDQKFICANVVKRRRIDMSDNNLSKITYLAHPFSPTNGLRLIDDINSDKILSLSSLITDIDGVQKEKTNAIERLKVIDEKSFDDDYIS